jgi:hypothetical protein
MHAHIAAGLLSAPAFRWNHGQERAPDVVTRGPHSVANGVQLLFDAHRIGASAVSSADRFRLDYLLGIEGVRDSDRVSGRCDPAALHVIQLARCHAVAAHRAIADVLGAAPTAWLVAFVVSDLSMSAMGRRFAGGGSEGRARMGGCIEGLLLALPGLYAANDRACGSGARRRRSDLRMAAAGEMA